LVQISPAASAAWHKAADTSKKQQGATRERQLSLLSAAAFDII